MRSCGVGRRQPVIFYFGVPTFEGFGEAGKSREAELGGDSTKTHRSGPVHSRRRLGGEGSSREREEGKTHTGRVFGDRSEDDTP